jgi:hypothetical protein
LGAAENTCTHDGNPSKIQAARSLLACCFKYLIAEVLKNAIGNCPAEDWQQARRHWLDRMQSEMAGES